MKISEETWSKVSAIKPKTYNQFTRMFSDEEENVLREAMKRGMGASQIYQARDLLKLGKYTKGQIARRMQRLGGRT